MKITPYLLFTSIVIFLFACSSNEKTTKKQAGVTLEGNYWKLTELNGKPVTMGPDTQEIYLTFNPDGLQVSGNGGCNGFGGNYELHSNGFNIRFKQIIRTEMACADQLNMDQENNFFRLLEMVDNFYLNNDQLQLNKGKMAPLALFKRLAAKPAEVSQ